MLYRVTCCVRHASANNIYIYTVYLVSFAALGHLAWAGNRHIIIQQYETNKRKAKNHWSLGIMVHGATGLHNHAAYPVCKYLHYLNFAVAFLCIDYIHPSVTSCMRSTHPIQTIDSTRPPPSLQCKYKLEDRKKRDIFFILLYIYMLRCW